VVWPGTASPVRSFIRVEAGEATSSVAYARPLSRPMSFGYVVLSDARSFTAVCTPVIEAMNSSVSSPTPAAFVLARSMRRTKMGSCGASDEDGGIGRGDFLGGEWGDWSFFWHKDGGPHCHLTPLFTMREGSLLDKALC
jgi:hypothetical protein